MSGMLSPVWAGTRAAELSDDHAVLDALLQVEAVWVETLAAGGHAEAEEVQALSELIEDRQDIPQLDSAVLAAAGADGGNPVIPLLSAVRAALAQRGTAAPALHRAATSQDVMDTALMMTARQTVAVIQADVRKVCAALAELANEHRHTICVARTLTQHALPTSFGMRAASWLDGVASASAELAEAAGQLPLQWGGAVGTQAALCDAVGTEAAAALTADLAERLDLLNPQLPWHVQRQPVLRLASALAGLLAALGKAATDVLTLQRPEVAELAEPRSRGRGGSSAMPQKQNPVLSVLLRSAAMQAPGHLGALHHSASLSADERPDGAWHAEWPALRELLRLGGGAAARAAELFAGLTVDSQRMRENLDAAGPSLFSERLVAALQDSHPEGKSGVQETIRDAVVSGEDLLDRLRAAISPEEMAPEKLEHVLHHALAPNSSLGRAEEFIDAALTAYREARI